ncbi:hypothetical protein [Aestuariibius sp. HNIBRBA575]|uniref:hypothetical protein n=1 Tax=Aestuariibius sp. HNIBRBA575 TaxID=3233343 RepID=UPI0034A3D68A
MAAKWGGIGDINKSFVFWPNNWPSLFANTLLGVGLVVGILKWWPEHMAIAMVALAGFPYSFLRSVRRIRAKQEASPTADNSTYPKDENV